MAELGLCVYIFQSIEASLKMLLPHIVVPGTETHAPGEGFDNWRIFIDSKLTLGPMMERLKERSTFSNPEAIDAEFRRLVTYRNEVIHHFAGKPFSRFASEEDYRAAFAFLSTRRMAALPLYELLQALLAEVMAVWSSSATDGEASAA